MDLNTMTDDEFYRHKRDVDQEASRRTRRATFAGEISAMVRDAADAGVSDEDVRATVETALQEAP